MGHPAAERLLRLSREAALVCDRIGGIAWADGRAERLLGARAGLPFERLAATGSVDKARAFLSAARAGETGPWELLLLVDGHPVLVAFRGAPEGEGALLVGSLVPEDAQAAQLRGTEAAQELGRLHREAERRRRELARARRSVEELLAREHEARLAAELERGRLRQVLDVLPEAVLIADAGGQYALANAAATELLGADLTGQPVPVGDEEAFGARRRDGTRLRARELPLQRALLAGETTHGEQLVVRRAGDRREVPLLANGAPIREPGGAVAGALVVFQDITALWELERQKAEFLAIVSHDLKNPLAGIRGWAQILLRRARRLPEAEQARWLEGLARVDDGVARMTGMLDELLDLTRQEMGHRLELRRVPTDLVALARQLVADHAEASENHRLQVEAPESALVGSWDPARLGRVVGNLLTNAVRYSPEGGEVLIAVAREADDAVLRVRDEGVGIPPDEMARIFERFHRARNVAGRIAGTGLGLAGARQIVELHGGSIAVESVEGRGSTFTVRLPLAASEVQAAEATQQ